MKYLILLIALTGCSEESWHDPDVVAIRGAECTSDQFAKVEHETDYCIAKNMVSSEFCFASAIQRNCTRI